MSTPRFVPVLALIAAFAAPLTASAQTAPPMPAASAPAGVGHHHHRHHQSLMRALRSLNLTPAQQQQVAAFRAQQKQADVNADSATRKANAAKMRDEVMGILTPDQKTQLAAAMHHHRGNPSTPNVGATPSPQ